MKACLHLQRRFAYVGHEIATLLKERHGVTEFCGYVFTRASYTFLKEQKDLTYTSLLLDEDIHAQYKDEKIDYDFLSQLEKDYGIPNLWPYIDIDRIVRYGQLVREYPHKTPPYTHEEMLRILQVKAKAVLKFLDDEKPDFIFFSAIGATASLLLYHIAKKKGIRTLYLLSTRVQSQYLISEHYSLFTGFERIAPSETHFEQAHAFLSSFRERPAPYARVDAPEKRVLRRSQHFTFLRPHNLVRSVYYTLRAWFGHFGDPARTDYSTIQPWHSALDRARRKLRVLIGYDDLYDEPIANEKYVYYPLHMEPEIVTMLLAPTYKDQLWIIGQIARSLPVGYKLYVKEHAAMSGFRPRSFYQELKKIPNVRLLRPNTNTKHGFDLIRNARLVTTLTGTVGWEATLFQKPVITFGDVFYNALSNVRRCVDVHDLPQLVREQLESFVHDEKELETFVAKIYAASVPLELSDIWQQEHGAHVKERRNELVPITDLLYKKARV